MTSFMIPVLGECTAIVVGARQHRAGMPGALVLLYRKRRAAARRRANHSSPALQRHKMKRIGHGCEADSQTGRILRVSVAASDGPAYVQHAIRGPAPSRPGPAASRREYAACWISARCKAAGRRTKAARQRKKPEHQVLGPQSTKEGGGDSSYYSESFVALQ